MDGGKGLVILKLYGLTFPLPSVLIKYTSRPPFPKENVLPTIIYPPSVVCCTELPPSSLVPPKVLFHCSTPLPSVFIRYTSLFPFDPVIISPPSLVY